jgi:nicotinamidase-related amidase
MRLSRGECIGIVVDFQERVVSQVDGREDLAASMERLVRGLQALEVPLLLVQHNTKGLGETIAPIRGLMEGRPRFEKITFSCCGEPGFLENLRSSGRTVVIVAGTESHVCVLQTVLDLLAAGFAVAVVEDAVGSRKPTDRRVALERMRQEGARITTVESLLFELTERAGTDAFREVLRLVK